VADLDAMNVGRDRLIVPKGSGSGRDLTTIGNYQLVMRMNMSM
jgi:hypothetical protein